jgi:hypothetical protein
MSGNEVFTTAHGPVFKSKLNLMGIRFLEGEAGAETTTTTYTPPATQEDLNKIIQSRLDRALKPFEGFDTIKEKAAKFDAIGTTEATTTVVADPKVTEKLTEFEGRVTTAERLATETQLKLDRSEVALEKGIAKEHLPLLTATTREDLEKQADAILKLTKGSGRVPGQGARDTTAIGGAVSSGREIFDNKRTKPKP